MKRNLRVSKLLTVMMVLFSMLACTKGGEAGNENKDSKAADVKVEKTETITLTDNVGRTVELPFPIERAVVSLRYNNELIRACGAIDNVIAVDSYTAQDRMYWKNFDPNNVIGKGQRELNYEKIIELNPQVLILPANGTYEEAIEKLTPFGIKVFVISGYDTFDFDNQINNIGAMFDKKEQAEQFKKYRNDTLNYIATQLEGVEKKTVYWEGIKDYKTSFPGNYYYNMIVASGGENIFNSSEDKEDYAIITPEEIVVRNPDFIIKHVTRNDSYKGTGVYVAPSIEHQQETIEAIKNRPGWDEINAVKNNDIYLMSQFGHGGASKLIGAVYMAKWMYPEELEELNPDEIFRAWLEDYQGFEFIEGHFSPFKYGGE